MSLSYFTLILHIASLVIAFVVFKYIITPFLRIIGKENLLSLNYEGFNLTLLLVITLGIIIEITTVKIVDYIRRKRSA